MDVEIFPTSAKILAAHKLRIAVQAFDVPQLLPTLPDPLGTLAAMTIHNSASTRRRSTFSCARTMLTLK